MKIVIFGLTISSAWGNGHATLLRGLFRALHAGGHEVHFFERNTPYYAAHRDAQSFPYVNLHLYSDWLEVITEARQELLDCDAGIITSYCQDGAAASELLLDVRPPRTVFYDMDTPVTLSRLELGESVSYLPPGGLADFDLVLSYTGGRSLDLIRTKLGAQRVSPLYGWVDPDAYFPAATEPRYQSSLSYLGTYSADRQAAFEELFIMPARQLNGSRFVVGGAMYQDADSWPSNVDHFEHVAPPDHRAFYSSSAVTLNITRASMAAMGYCPSGRIFEASACGIAVLSDYWGGLETFLEPGKEILLAASTKDVLSALSMDNNEIKRIGKAGRERTLDCHTAAIRTRTLIDLLENRGEALRNSEPDLSLVEEV